MGSNRWRGLTIWPGFKVLHLNENYNCEVAVSDLALNKTQVIM